MNKLPQKNCYFATKTHSLKQFLKVLFSVVIIILLTSNCARKGRPNGGLKDSIAPLMVTANPPYQSLNFSSKKIKISFDEYITLKDINKQLIISPPLKFIPTITPQGTPSKNITIKITDTLKENTTYTFNFGNSIQDNNEGNQLKSFKYVFSTGKYIDSLTTKGIVKDAYKKEFDKNINVLLYKIDSTYQDSIIYKQKPNYLASTLDTTLFNFSNLEKGKYLVIALKDISSNYIFNPKEDKIGFYSKPIELPKDSVLKNPISLFKETATFNLKRPKQINKGKIIFGFEGDATDLKIELLTSVTADFKSILKFEPQKDTLNYWHSNIKNDSLTFKVSNKNYTDTLTVFLRKKEIDSLKVNSNISRTLDLRDTITLTTNNPVTNIDSTKITLLDKDSIKVAFTKLTGAKTNKIKILFKKKYNQNYKLMLFPKALTDIFETKNDTLTYLFNTKEPEDYGSITLNLSKNPSTQVIVELLNEQSKKLVERVITSKSTVNFNLLPTGKYLIRVIIDSNKNSQWDTGNYLQKIQPEKVLYHPATFNIRSNWHLPSETLTIN